MTNELAVKADKATSIFDAEVFSHWMNVANQLSKSTMIPKQYMGKPMDILVAVEMGKQVGLSMMQALQNIAVINGKPSIYGDGLPAICMSHSSYEYMKEEPIMNGKDISGYSCTVKRKFHEPKTITFTIEDAKKAGLWGKQGPWSQYPNRMLQMRARGFALRDMFPDALQGIDIAEEANDMQIIEGSVVKNKQADKANYLMSLKGQPTHEARTAQTNDNPINSFVDVTTGEIHCPNPPIDAQTEEKEMRERMASVTKSNDSIESSKNEGQKVTAQQLDAIDCLLNEKGCDKTSQLKALDHFGLTSFTDLTEQQAELMIRKLNKMENKVA